MESTPRLTWKDYAVVTFIVVVLICLLGNLFFDFVGGKWNWRSTWRRVEGRPRSGGVTLIPNFKLARL